MEVSRPDDSAAMMALRRLALPGPPLTREDRISRQDLADRLALPPELYNLLVFGESGDTAAASIADIPPICARPPALPPSP